MGPGPPFTTKEVMEFSIHTICSFFSPNPLLHTGLLELQGDAMTLNKKRQYQNSKTYMKAVRNLISDVNNLLPLPPDAHLYINNESSHYSVNGHQVFQVRNTECNAYKQKGCKGYRDAKYIPLFQCCRIDFIAFSFGLRCQQ